MFIRTTYALGDPAKIEESLDALRNEAPKLLGDSPGYRRFGLFADREQGKILMGSWWETERDRENSEEHLADRRTTLLSPFADTANVENYEIAHYVDAGEPLPGACFRLGRFIVDPSRVDELVAMFKERAGSTFPQMPGHLGSTMIIDRTRGFGGVGTLFTDRDALVASRGPQSAVRGAAAQRTGLRPICLEEFEVVLLENKIT
jgi:hypothetical protein